MEAAIIGGAAVQEVMLLAFEIVLDMNALWVLPHIYVGVKEALPYSFSPGHQIIFDHGESVIELQAEIDAGTGRDTIGSGTGEKVLQQEACKRLVWEQIQALAAVVTAVEIVVLNGRRVSYCITYA
ncbi:hypothetical protein IAQ61_004975 [Plenodomus lingam]|uniref:uncharacterized protein n=1 Tax=Leptosphaeria maculans TaxID=5022 RepID=UPI00331E703E|nr:hypothetical protein IAQ61_004975 [Plenodomus lingam]